MDEDVFNMSVRKFLKKVGVTAQREIEQAVREALDSGKITDDSAPVATVTLKVPSVGLDVEIDGKLDLK